MAVIKIKVNNEWVPVSVAGVQPYDDTALKADIDAFKLEVTTSNELLKTSNELFKTDITSSNNLFLLNVTNDNNLFKQDINNLIGTISTALDEINGEVI